MALDKEKIKKRLTYLNDSIVALKSILPRTLSGYKDAKDETQRATERHLQIISEIELDIIATFYKSLDKKAVGGEELIFDALEETLGKKVIADAKERRNLRNSLVHAYPIIDHERVYRQASSTKDLEEFEKAVRKAIGGA